MKIKYNLSWNEKLDMMKFIEIGYDYLTNKYIEFKGKFPDKVKATRRN